MNERAVSEVVASLFMIMVVVAVGTTLYVYSIGLFSDIKTNVDLSATLAEERLREKFSVNPHIDYDSDEKILYLYVYSYGEIEARIAGVYVDGTYFPCNVTINPGFLGNITVENVELANITPHSLVVVSERGNKVEIQFQA